MSSNVDEELLAEVTAGGPPDIADDVRRLVTGDLSVFEAARPAPMSGPLPILQDESRLAQIGRLACEYLTLLIQKGAAAQENEASHGQSRRRYPNKRFEEALEAFLLTKGWRDHPHVVLMQDVARSTYYEDYNPRESWVELESDDFLSIKRFASSHLHAVLEP